LNFSRYRYVREEKQGNGVGNQNWGKFLKISDTYDEFKRYVENEIENWYANNGIQADSGGGDGGGGGAGGYDTSSDAEFMVNHLKVFVGRRDPVSGHTATDEDIRTVASNYLDRLLHSNRRFPKDLIQIYIKHSRTLNEFKTHLDANQTSYETDAGGLGMFAKGLMYPGQGMGKNDYYAQRGGSPSASRTHDDRIGDDDSGFDDPFPDPDMLPPPLYPPSSPSSSSPSSSSPSSSSRRSPYSSSPSSSSRSFFSGSSTPQTSLPSLTPSPPRSFAWPGAPAEAFASLRL
jgi:hypothetical protein